MTEQRNPAETPAPPVDWTMLKLDMGEVIIHGSPQERREFYKAFALAQSKFGVIEKTRTVKAKSYSYDYAPLDVVLAATVPHLNEHGIAFLQPTVRGETGVSIRSLLLHEGGASMEATLHMTVEGDFQDLGKAITYCRRYCAQSLLGVSSEFDSDKADEQGEPEGYQDREPRRQQPARPPANQQRPPSRPNSDPPPDARQKALPANQADPGAIPVTEETREIVRKLLTDAGFKSPQARMAELRRRLPSADLEKLTEAQGRLVISDLEHELGM